MQVKYDNHPNEWLDIANNQEKFLHASSWFNKNTLDYWRHARIRSSALPVITDGKNKKWLTVGDGRFGTDANYLMAHGVEDVMATDISDTLLKIGSDRGFIKKYSAQNAESLKFSDEEFEYTYCKESYHHFPRPYIALYEMLRVSKFGIILTEPAQQKQSFLLKIIKKLIGKKSNPHSFETIGNYVYTISTSEIEKLMLGIGLRYYAYFNMNDHYIPGVEEIKIIGGTFYEKLKCLEIKLIIKFKDFLSKIRLINANLITIVIFKEIPNPSLIVALVKFGYTFVELPKNPYSRES